MAKIVSSQLINELLTALVIKLLEKRSLPYIYVSVWKSTEVQPATMQAEAVRQCMFECLFTLLYMLMALQ